MGDASQIVLAQSGDVVVRHALVDDVDQIERILAPYAARQILLPRDRDDIFEHLQEFLVAEVPDGEAARVGGVICAHIYGKNLAELRSLAVDSACQQHGLGRLLVAACEDWLKTLGVERLFALTYVTDFFRKQGYRVVSKESLPHKIWTVCVHCPRFSDCDEVAVEKLL